MTCIAIFTSFGKREEAQRTAHALVDRNLVACAQISEIESFYRWDGKVQNEVEFRLLVKTVDTNYGVVAEAIKMLHSYTLPAIHAVAFEQVDSDYAEWIVSNSKVAMENS